MLWPDPLLLTTLQEHNVDNIVVILSEHKR